MAKQRCVWVAFVLAPTDPQRAAQRVQQIQHNTADCAGRAENGSTPPAHTAGESTPNSTDLEQEVMRVIRTMILAGKIPEPPT